MPGMGSRDAEMEHDGGGGGGAGAGSVPAPATLSASTFTNGVRTDTPHPLKRATTPGEAAASSAANH